ncbi:telomere stability and silencing-domain-containing protein [Cantharellus anzutake]|uniref:telomere stability and silencing-domain-containing protein n=1 Tax=Cantharellus anzutake TaxID=1750568 RepID=UPI001905821D|nr:telomere stability and silencing-domain-containing protein [Cantharellus anzutake]KAF8339847.1 telomere stability and silencing-domain-containing protein [Cantharellus anzutake]
MQTSTILISTFPPFPTLALDVPNETHVEDLPGFLASRFPHVPFHLPSTVLSSASGPLCLDNRPISSLISRLKNEVSHPQLISLRLSPLVMGGKGGFGSQLRAAGGRMSSQKTSNNDSCRDLNGRRISTVKQAQQLAEYVENEPARKKAAAEAQRAKLEALEKRLGIEPKAGSSSGPVAGQKHRFDDTEYLEQSKDLVDGVKSAVAAGPLYFLGLFFLFADRGDSRSAEKAKEGEAVDRGRFLIEGREE